MEERNVGRNKNARAIAQGGRFRQPLAQPRGMSETPVFA